MKEINGKSIILSVDDFGISHQASINALELIRKGRADRVEIMISDYLSPEHVSQLLNSSVKLDIHFHLAKDQLGFWQDHPRTIEKGAVKRVFVFLYNVFFGHNRPRMIEREWERQLLDFQRIFGRMPDGASSHEHIHFFPPYFKKFLGLCQKYNLKYIRLGKKSHLTASPVSAILDMLRKFNLRQLKKTKFSTSDYMVSFDWIDNFDSFIRKAPEGKEIEIIFHPELEQEYKTLENL